MRKFVIIILYILVFWGLIPALLIGTSNYLEVALNLRLSPSPVAGLIVLFFSLPMLGITIRQYFKFSGELPVSAYPPKNILRRGIYNYWRHPIYLFYIITFIGIALIMGSYTMLLIVLPVFSLVTYIYTLIEENGLTKRFGKAYIYYKKRTGLIFPCFYQCIRYPSLLFFKYLFHYETKHSEFIPVSPPYFVISEHKNYLDPIILGLSLPHPVSYLTTFEMYRSPVMIWFMGLFCNIPRKRFKPDYKSNKLMLEALDKGAVIGIFPEGERSWTGETQHFKPEVLKLLLKKHYIPILPVKIIGNYPAWPRWANGYKRYKITVEIRDPFYPDSTWSAEELEKKIRDRIGNSNIPEKISEKSSCFGVGLERVFYRCSECGEFNSFKVDKSIMTCEKCGFALHISPDLKIIFNKNGSTRHMSIDEYYRSIKVNSEDPVFKKSGRVIDKEEIIVDLQESGKCQLSAEKGLKFESVLNGDLLLSENSIICKNEHKTSFFLYQDISSVTTESNDKLQLFHHETGQLYQLKFQKGSVLQWQDIIISAILQKTGRTVNMR